MICHECGDEMYATPLAHRQLCVGPNFEAEQRARCEREARHTAWRQERDFDAILAAPPESETDWDEES